MRSTIHDQKRFLGRYLTPNGLWFPFRSVAFVFLSGLLYGQVPTVISVLNSADYSTNFTPGMPVFISGTNVTGDVKLFTVTVNEKAAYLSQAAGPPGCCDGIFYTQIPYEVPVGPATLVVTRQGIKSAPFSLTLVALAPTFEINPLIGFSHQTSGLVGASSPATPGEILTIYALGLGATNPPTPSGVYSDLTLRPLVSPSAITVGGKTAQIFFAGSQPGASGLYVINFKVPSDLAEGNQPVILTVSDKSSKPAMLLVGKAIPRINSAANAATLTPRFEAVPGSFYSIFADNIGAVNNLAAFPATEANGISVLFGNKPAAIFALIASAGQINVLVPGDLPETGTITLQVKNSVGLSMASSVKLKSAQPAVFRLVNPKDPKQVSAAAILANTAWLTIPSTLASALSVPACTETTDPTSTCARSAKPGDYVQIYLTGMGKATPNADPSGAALATGQVAPADGSTIYQTVQTPQVSVAGTDTPVLFSGIAPGSAGLYQLNIRLPDDAPDGDAVPVRISMPNGTFDTTSISVRK